MSKFDIVPIDEMPEPYAPPPKYKMPGKAAGWLKRYYRRSKLPRSEIARRFGIGRYELNDFVIQHRLTRPEEDETP